MWVKFVSIMRVRILFCSHYKFTFHLILKNMLMWNKINKESMKIVRTRSFLNLEVIVI